MNPKDSLGNCRVPAPGLRGVRCSLPLPAALHLAKGRCGWVEPLEMPIGPWLTGGASGSVRLPQVVARLALSGSGISHRGPMCPALDSLDGFSVKRNV